MQFIDETEIKEEDVMLSHANNPRELKRSENCLLSNKGSLKECDRMIFKHNYIICNDAYFNYESRVVVSDNCTKNPNSCDREEINHKEDECKPFIELKIDSFQRVSPKNGMYLGQKRFSSTIILADMFN